MKLSIPSEAKENVLNELQIANLAFQKVYPGENSERQPVHTVYGGANLFKSDTTVKMGQIALKSFKTNAPNFSVLAKVLELTGHESLPTTVAEINAFESRLDKMSDSERKNENAWLPYTVYKKVIAKLE